MRWSGLDNVLAVHLGAARYTVFGRDLLPYSLMHKELLRLADHPFVTGSRVVTLMDMELASRLLSLTPSEAAQESLRRIGFCERWGRTLRALWQQWRGPDPAEVFTAYFESCSGPSENDLMTMASEGSSGASLALPETLDLLIQLSEIGISWDTAASVWPLGLAQWTFLTHLARKTGQVGFVTDEHRQAVAEMKAEAEKEKQREAQERERNEREGNRAMRFLRRFAPMKNEK